MILLVILEEYVSWKDKAFEIIEKFDLEGSTAFRQCTTIYVEFNDKEDAVYKGELNKLNTYRPNADKKHIGPFDHSYPYLAPVASSCQICAPEAMRNCFAWNSTFLVQT